MDAENPLATDELQQAFAVFNDIAGSLQHSYSALELQTHALREELGRVEAQRQDEQRRTKRVTRKLENLLQSLPGGVVLLDSQGYVEDSNSAALDLLGAPLSGELWLNVIDRAFDPQLDDGHEISLKDGRRISLATRSLDQEPGQIILLTDQTDTRRLQAKLHHNERLVEMGRMMAALAHQIRTPLASATLYAHHLQNESLDQTRSSKFAIKVSTQLAAIEQQIRDMLVFARSDLPVTERITLTNLMSGLEDAMAVSVSKSNADCDVSCESGAFNLFCNREVLIGALTNLVSNSLQSRDDVTIKVSACVIAKETIRITVEDNGAGFDADDEKPFFSNKPQGTGLGLAVVRAVVAAHQGQFELRSVKGTGTTAVVVLPVAPAQAI